MLGLGIGLGSGLGLGIDLGMGLGIGCWDSASWAGARHSASWDSASWAGTSAYVDENKPVCVVRKTKKRQIFAA